MLFNKPSRYFHYKIHKLYIYREENPLPTIVASIPSSFSTSARLPPSSKTAVRPPPQLTQAFTNQQQLKSKVEPVSNVSDRSSCARVPVPFPVAADRPIVGEEALVLGLNLKKKAIGGYARGLYAEKWTPFVKVGIRTSL